MHRERETDELRDHAEQDGSLILAEVLSMVVIDPISVAANDDVRSPIPRQRQANVTLSRCCISPRSHPLIKAR